MGVPSLGLDDPLEKEMATHSSILAPWTDGNPLQYSCLKNPMDRGAWQVTVHGAAKSQTRLKQFST